MNTIIIGNGAYLTAIVLAARGLEGKTVLIVKDESVKSLTTSERDELMMPIRNFELKSLELKDMSPAPRRSSDQPWKKPWKR